MSLTYKVTSLTVMGCDMSFSPTMSGPWTSGALVPDYWGLPCSVALIPSCMYVCLFAIE
jgi:hypothetical protein